jgi:alkylhydroperoxidase family enzyme
VHVALAPAKEPPVTKTSPVSVSVPQYRLHTIESAPEKARDGLRALQHDFGFIPNVAATMAESPVEMNAFVPLFKQFHSGTLTETHRQVLLLSNAVANTSAWAVAMHSTLSLQQGVDASDVQAMREGRLPAEPKQAALSALTRVLIERRGHADDVDLATFSKAGFSPAQALEVVVGLAGSTFTNYTAGITNPALEDIFQAQAWSPGPRTAVEARAPSTSPSAAGARSPFRVHTLESAPEGSRDALRGLKQAFGLIPNAAAIMAESPILVNGFVGVFKAFHGGTFTGAQRQALLLSNAVANASPWPVAFHSTMALKEGVAPDDVLAIRGRRLPKDAALAALSAYTRALIEKRGRVDARDLAAFIGAGFSHDQVLEVVVGLAISAMANYTANIAKPPVEDAFAAQTWRP